MAQYGRAEYWEERYSRDLEPFDWYQRWPGLKDTLTQHILPTHQILHIGCGHSRLSAEMYEDAFVNSVNIDISQVAVKNMAEKYRDKPTMRFIHMDTRSMEDFGDATFDGAIDKGTLDAVLCGDNSTANVNKMLSEICRVLAPTGVYICISYGQPPNRLVYLDKPEFNWEVTASQVAKMVLPGSTVTENSDGPNVHFIYVCRKRGGD